MKNIHPENQFFNRTLPDRSNNEGIRFFKADSASASMWCVPDPAY
jgi:hypothetical protein